MKKYLFLIALVLSFASFTSVSQATVCKTQLRAFTKAQMTTFRNEYNASKKTKKVWSIASKTGKANKQHSITYHSMPLATIKSKISQLFNTKPELITLTYRPANKVTPYISSPKVQYAKDKGCQAIIVFAIPHRVLKKIKAETSYTKEKKKYNRYNSKRVAIRKKVNNYNQKIREIRHRYRGRKMPVSAKQRIRKLYSSRSQYQKKYTSFSKKKKKAKQLFKNYRQKKWIVSQSTAKKLKDNKIGIMITIKRPFFQAIDERYDIH